MTNPNKSHITFILDRSGSMDGIRQDVIGGTNTFLRDQQAVPGECTFTLIQFDSQDPYEVVANAEPLASVKPLTTETYVPRGGTPLYDAVGRAINELGAQLAAMPEDQRPGRVVFVIQTDGLENASKEFTSEMIKTMIDRQKKEYNWQFLFLGANQDAIVVAGNIGIDRKHALNYSNTGSGYKTAMRASSGVVRGLRSSVGGQSVGFSDEDRKEATAS